MGWQVEQIIDMDSFPILKRMEVGQAADFIKLFEEDIKIENKVTNLYDKIGR
ncbi:MAG: hypothetical protein IZT57_05310 [Chloroflexi bacterium]|nr:hypothetical protein [Chloroflexota bacterium]